MKIESPNKKDRDAMKIESPILPAHERKGSAVEIDGKNANDKAIQLSNGIIIEELDMGKPDGNIASLGSFPLHRKVEGDWASILFKCWESSGEISSRLLTVVITGRGEVPELWNVGLDGMLVGGKRRLTVPPSFRNEIQFC
ncbi:hypothetical protein REPUB_Repub03eG0163000 [Reevesia pubescens]